MRRGIALFFLSIYLMGVTPLGELCKLPKLYEHFQEHRSDSPSLSILEFLEMHYFNGDPMDADYEEDMKLPFKSPDQLTSEFAQLSIEMPYLPLSTYYSEEHFTKGVSLKPGTIVPSYSCSIWEPPQVA